MPRLGFRRIEHWVGIVEFGWCLRVIVSEKSNLY